LKHNQLLDLLDGSKTAEVQLPDDLTLLEGIGPKVNSVLASAGITTFSQMAEIDLKNLKEILDAAGYKYMDPTSWPEQARLLAEGILRNSKNGQQFERRAEEVELG